MTSGNSRRCVLIVDDDRDLAAVMQLALQRAGFEVHAAFTARAALDWLAERRPDALVLDLMLPDKTGFALLRHLQARETTEPLPAVVLTARKDGRNGAAGEVHGQARRLPQPADPRQLVEHVQQALTLR